MGYKLGPGFYYRAAMEDIFIILPLFCLIMTFDTARE
jgi:hypothetical protein